jgi:hypothetical protein
VWGILMSTLEEHGQHIPFNWLIWKVCCMDSIYLRPMPSNPCLFAVPKLMKNVHVWLSTFSTFGHACSKVLYSLEGHVGLSHLSCVPHLGDSIQSSTGLECPLHSAPELTASSCLKNQKSMTGQVLPTENSFHWHILKSVFSFCGYKISGATTCHNQHILSSIPHNQSQARYTV